MTWVVWRALAGMLVGMAMSASAAAETPKSVFVMARALDDVITLDPAEAFEFSATEIIANMYQRLFRANPQDPANPIAELAEDWSVDSTGRTYRFTLRADRVFHSGNPITAGDAAFSLQRVVKLNKTPAFILTQFGLRPDNVDQRVRALDHRTLSLTVDRAYAPTLVLNVLSAAVASVVDRVQLAAVARDGDFGHQWLRRNSAGSGPFKLRRWQPGEYLMLDAAANVTALERVIIRDIREPATQRVMLMRGDIDMARNLGPDQIAALGAVDGIATWSVPEARLYYLGLNQRHPILRLPEVRQAMRLLIDYQTIAETVLAGRATVHQAFLPRGLFGALDDRPFGLDPAQARALLAAAGHGDGFTVTMDARSDPINMQLAQAIQASMALAGVRIEIIPGDGKQTLTKYRARRHDIYIGQWGPDYLDPHSNAAAFARNPDNADGSSDKTLAWRNGWDIPALSRATDQAVLTADPAARRALYADLQRQVQADSPFIVLFQENTLIAARANVTGFAAGLTSDQTSYRDIVKR